MVEQFSLCWDNFHSNLSTSFSALLKSEDLVDVTLAAEGRYLKAHKIVLSICSPYFQELFKTNPCQHPIVFLKDVSYSALSNLLQFMYQGEVKVSQDELTNFIKVAEALKIKGLTGDGMKESSEEKHTTAEQNDVTEPIPKETVTLASRKSLYEQRASPTRKKMMGPASKRFRASEPPLPPPLQQSKPEVPQHIIEDVRTVPQEEEVMHFKMEPEEMSSTYHENEEDMTAYDDTNPDASNMSDPADYLMESTMENDIKDARPGPSTNTELTESTSDNQGSFFMKEGKGHPKLVFEGYKFRRNGHNSKTQSTFWICSNYRKSNCKCRCVTTADGQVSRSKIGHCHPLPPLPTSSTSSDHDMFMSEENLELFTLDMTVE